MRKSFTVQGMTCEHCVASVTEEVGEVAGVESVHVDLPTGRVEVVGAAVADDAVRTAVEDAGFALLP